METEKPDASETDRAIAELREHQAETDRAIVAIARAVGVDEKHLSAELVKRSSPPPAMTEGGAPPAKAQQPTIPVATQYTRLAVAFVFIEAVREAIALINHFTH